ncbi:ABC-type transport auxiliary lipoprotein family protein [Neptunomonas qingdaonensis]|uniref:Cholesterol transport system auxiliary component n=1 Tax=Neptunomonas qingdaonensis TaxID=1045558 RepID=A0A1I2P5A9_9GAMM|nr:hypothetical protein [Neptunomonas qingdaonensis]SFG10660.1 cholesterol transport system auxiliary component [Neptunomonas qingdaonensis]
MKNSRVLIYLSLVFLLSGCALKPLPAVDIYTVAPKTPDQIDNETQTARQPQRSITLKLAPMQGVRSFSATDITYSDGRHGRNKYAYSRWSDAPVRLMQTYIQVVLEQSKQFLAVVPSTSVSDSDYLLESVMLDFSHHFKEANDSQKGAEQSGLQESNSQQGVSEGVIRMHFYLINSRTKKMIAGREFITIVPALSNDAAGAAIALNEGASNIVRDLALWVAEQRLR